jgi:hypothetical protein
MYYHVSMTMEGNESLAATARGRMMVGAIRSLTARDNLLMAMSICKITNKIYLFLVLFLASPGAEVKHAAYARQALMLHFAKTKVLQRGMGISAAVVVRQGTQATTVKRQILARLEAMAKHAKMEVLQREVVRWQIVGAVVRLGTQATTVKRQILARLGRTGKHVNTMESL